MVFLTADPVRSQSWRCTSSEDAACAAAWAVAHADPGPFCELPRSAYKFTPLRLSVVSDFGLVCADGWRVALANSAYFVGIWAGSSPFGWLSDRSGRRTCLIASNIATALACVLCAAAPGIWTYAACRCLIGFAAAGLPIGSYLLATEAVGPALRGVAGLTTQLIYHPGEWLLPLLSSLLHDWRHLNLSLACVCLFGAAAATLIPESPRWLLSQGRAEEAEGVVAWLAGWNGREMPAGARLSSGDAEEAPKAGGAAGSTGKGYSRVHQQDAEAEGAPATQKQLQAATDGGTGGGDPQSWRVLFSHPLLRRSLLVTSGLAAVAAITFFVAGLTSDALEGYSVEGAFFITSLAEVPAYIIGMAAIDTAGRKATVLTFLMISGLSCLGCAILGPGLAQIILATVNRGVISAAWGCVYIVAAETCITPLRSQALGINNQAARLAGVLAPGVPFLAARLRAPGLSFWVMGVIGVAASAAVLLLPETRGVPQADTIEQLEEIHSASACRAAGGAAGAAAAATHKGAAPTAHRQGGPRGGAGVADHCGRGESVVREEFWDDAYEEPDVERRPLVGRGAGGSGGDESDEPVAGPAATSENQIIQYQPQGDFTEELLRGMAAVVQQPGGGGGGAAFGDFADAFADLQLQQVPGTAVPQTVTIQEQPVIFDAGSFPILGLDGTVTFQPTAASPAIPPSPPLAGSPMPDGAPAPLPFVPAAAPGVPGVAGFPAATGAAAAPIPLGMQAMGAGTTTLAPGIPLFPAAPLPPASAPMAVDAAPRVETPPDDDGGVELPADLISSLQTLGSADLMMDDLHKDELWETLFGGGSFPGSSGGLAGGGAAATAQQGQGGKQGGKQPAAGV